VTTAQISDLERVVSRLDTIASSVVVAGGQDALLQVERICDNLSRVSSALQEGTERLNDLHLLGVVIGAKQVADRLSEQHSCCVTLLQSSSRLLAEIKVTGLTLLTEGPLRSTSSFVKEHRS
jgi:hypothetical protein